MFRTMDTWEKICAVVFFPVLLPFLPVVLLVGDWTPSFHSVSTKSAKLVDLAFSATLATLAVASAWLLFWFADGVFNPWYIGMIDKHWVFTYALLPLALPVYVGGAISFFMGGFKILGAIWCALRLLLSRGDANALP